MIKVDVHEKKFIPYLRNYFDIEELNIVKLKHGDVELEDYFVLERKTTADLWSSIIDGRLFAQAEGMAEMDVKRYLLVVGNMNLYGNRYGYNINAITSALASLSMNYGIELAMWPTSKIAARFVYDLYRKATKESTPHVARIKPKKIDQRLLVLMGIRGIGSKTASNIIKRFKNIRNVANAPINEIKDIIGMGEKTADKVWRALNEPDI